MTAPSTDVPPGGPGDFLYRLCRPMLPALGDWRTGPMAPSLYAFVLQVSRRQQVRLAVLTLALLPLSMLPLELQRRIVNDAVAHAELERLLVYGALYLGVLLLQGGLKFARDLYLHGIAESVTQLLRRRIVRRETAADIEDGTRQSILAAESEKVGGFVAESIALPLLQAGTVISITGYMLAMGAAGGAGGDRFPGAVGRDGRLLAACPEPTVALEDPGRARAGPVRSLPALAG